MITGRVGSECTPGRESFGGVFRTTLRETQASRSRRLIVSNKWIYLTLFLPLTDFGLKGLFPPYWEHIFPLELDIHSEIIYLYKPALLFSITELVLPFGLLIQSIAGLGYKGKPIIFEVMN